MPAPMPTSRRSLHCVACGWSFVGDANGAAPGPCPHCWRAELSPAADTSALPVEKLVPFALSQAQIDAAITSFAKGIPHPPTDLEASTLRKRKRAMALPVYLVDADVKATWQAQAGFDYQVVSHREQNAGAGWQTEQIEETRVRWEPRVGRLERSFQNLHAPALEEHDELMQRLSHYDTSKAVDAQPRGADAATLMRLPDRPTTDAWHEATASLHTAAADECRKAAGAQHIREFHWQPTCDNPNWTLLHLPVWGTHYTDDDGKPQPVLINGQTGHLWGQRRGSMKRARGFAFTLLAIGALVFALAIVIALVALALPLLMPVAGTVAVVGLAIAAGSAVPVGRVWGFNREERRRERPLDARRKLDKNTARSDR